MSKNAPGTHGNPSNQMVYCQVLLDCHPREISAAPLGGVDDLKNETKMTGLPSVPYYAKFYRDPLASHLAIATCLLTRFWLYQPTVVAGPIEWCRLCLMVNLALPTPPSPSPFPPAGFPCQNRCPRQGRNKAYMLQSIQADLRIATCAPGVISLAGFYKTHALTCGHLVVHFYLLHSLSQAL